MGLATLSAATATIGGGKVIGTASVVATVSGTEV